MALNWDAPVPLTENLNPLDAELTSDPDARAVWTKARSSVGALARAFDQVDVLCDSMDAQVTQIRANSRLTVEARREDETQVRNRAMEAIENLRRSCEKSYNSIQTTIANVQNSAAKAAGSADTMLQVERERDAWNRTRMALDGQPTAWEAERLAGEKIAEASAMRDQETVRAIYNNLQAYLEGRQLAKSREMVRDSLNRAIGITESPAYRAAMQIQNVVETGWRDLQVKFNQALMYARGTSPSRVHGLAGWPGVPPTSL